MPFSFPSSPVLDDIYTYNSTSWIWNGEYWRILSSSSGSGGGGGGGISLSDLSVLTASSSPQASLTYNGATGEFTFSPNDEIPIATTSTLGGIKPDNVTFTVDSGGIASIVKPVVYPAVTKLDVGNNAAIAYTFSSYSGDNPTLTFTAGTTVAFYLNAPGHPFVIQTSASANYNNGLVHVGSNDVISTGSNAQSKTSGILYWNIPPDIIGPYKYVCGAHAVMTGTINIINPSFENFLDLGVQNTYDYNAGLLFYTSGRSSNWQANFINVPTIENSVISFNIIVNQGSTAYYPNTVTINSTATAVQWANSVPSASKKDIVSFLMYYKSSAFVLLGNISSYG
jgi:plastocyanin